MAAQTTAIKIATATTVQRGSDARIGFNTDIEISMSTPKTKAASIIAPVR